LKNDRYNLKVTGENATQEGYRYLSSIWKKVKYEDYLCKFDYFRLPISNMNTPVGNDKGEPRTADGRKRLGKNRDGETNGKRDERNN
jgi:hypothetical protein